MTEQYQCAAYLRLSKEDATAEKDSSKVSNSIANQKEYIQEYVRNRPELILHKYYVDDGYSGVTFDRPAFRELLADIEKKVITCIIVKDLSRLGRNYIEAGKYTQRLFPLWGVRFIAINDYYDSADAAFSSMMLPFKNLMNDAYSRDISIKIRSHLEIKRKRGEFIGAFPVYGYQKGEDKNQLVVDPFAAKVVKEIFWMKQDGMSQQAIANRLNSLGVLSPAEYKKAQGSGYRTIFQTHSRAKWSAMAVFRILTNEVYTGTLLQGKESTPNYKISIRKKKPSEEWIRVEQTHEAIINKETFTMTQELLTKDRKTAPGQEKLPWYAGFVSCADCGAPMIRKKTYAKTEYVYLVCAKHKKQKTCSSHSISEKSVCNLVIKVIEDQSALFLTGDKTTLQENLCDNRRNQREFFLMQAEQARKQRKRIRYLARECEQDYNNGVLTEEEYQMIQEELAIWSNENKQAIHELEQGQKQNQEDQAQLPRSFFVSVVSNIAIYEKKRVEITFRFRHSFAATEEVGMKC